MGSREGFVSSWHPWGVFRSHWDAALRVQWWTQWLKLLLGWLRLDGGGPSQPYGAIMVSEDHGWKTPP